MRKILAKALLPVFILMCLLISNNTYTQNSIAGYYDVTGIIFHPLGPRNVAQTKTLTKINPNTYQGYIADTYLFFEFQIDNNNNLINWSSGYSASGFMTSDNPGGFVYSSIEQPGVSPWLHSTYNNTYDPVTHTFYMHYGYDTQASSADESLYSRQIYEKWVLKEAFPVPDITSFFPTSGTSGTLVTIKGKNFTGVDTNYGVSFGGRICDNVTYLTDTLMTVLVGSGATGNVSVRNNFGIDSASGFVYTPPVVNNTQWQPAGNAGFSVAGANYVNITADNNGVPYVIFTDSSAGNKAIVMRYDSVHNKWMTVGPPASDEKCSYTNIAFGNSNIPFIAYIDSNKNISVKKFNGSTWSFVGNPAFASSNLGFSHNKVALAVDGLNKPYVIINNLEVMKFNGTFWVPLGSTGLGALGGYGDAGLAVDKKTNTPYIVSDAGPSSGFQAIVKKYNGLSWVTVGTVGFTTGKNGIFFPDIVVDSSGTPLVSFQEDNGREQTSVYKFNGFDWQLVGNKYFSPGHATFVSLAVDKKGTPFTFFSDASYNSQGTVMQSTPNLSQPWSILGARGFAATPGYLGPNAGCVINGTPYIAFADKNQNYKVTVLKYFPPSILVASNPSDTACRNRPVTYTASVFGDEANPSYQWKKNGRNVGNSTNVYTDNTPKDKDTVYCILTIGSGTYRSNKVGITVVSIPERPVIASNGNTIDICPKETVLLTSSSANSYLWSTGATTQSIIVTDPGKYTVTVSNGGACNATSSVVNVIYQPCTNPSDLVVTNITKKSAQLNWAADSCAIGYQYEWRKKGTSFWTATQTTGNSRVIAGLSPNTTYQWRVLKACRVKPDTVNSGYTTGPEFTTLSFAAINGNIATELKVRNNKLQAIISPNPTTGNATLVISNTNERVTIKVSDASGKVIWQAASIAERNIIIPSQNFASGVYMVQVTCVNETKTLKMIKL